MTIEKLGLTTKALQIVTEKPRLWEYRLFAQVIIDEIETVNRLFQRGHNAQTVIPDKISALPDLIDWLSKKNKEILVILNQLTDLVNSNTYEISSMSENIGGIVEYSRKIVVFYYQAIAWSQIVQNTPVDSRYEEIRREIDALSKGISTSIEQFGHELLKQINDAINSPSTGKPRTLTITLEVEISTDRIHSALERLTQEGEYTIDDIDLMTGQEFENFIAELFSRLGYETEITKASGDQGIDVIALKNGVKIGIQTKCYSGTIGNRAIQEAV
ncbi:MAG TPA: hypothetical protein DHW49_01445, partial [Anaerolineae bacterium]|nr:hypothetical protein [Anaerolineae bacterium]